MLINFPSDLLNLEFDVYFSGAFSLRNIICRVNNGRMMDDLSHLFLQKEIIKSAVINWL